jgi:hypothetical protein
MRVLIRRRSDSSWVSPGPRVPLGEDVQDEAGSVHHPPSEQTFQVALLGAGEFLVQNDQVHACAAAADLLRLPLADEETRIQAVPFLQDRVRHTGAGGPGKLLELGQGILGLPARLVVAAHAHQERYLASGLPVLTTGDG